MTLPNLIHWCEGESCCDRQWEQAYRDFETPTEEVAKFRKRFRILGVDQWARDRRVVELFCGRGNGLVALAELGFRHLEGVDLSPELLRQYQGSATLYVGDCRDLQFNDASKDVLIVQGGLHHLPSIPDDLAAVLDEVVRVLHGEGQFVIVEPWETPFLRVVHAACEVRLLRRAWSKLDALARMTEREIDTYRQWLSRPAELLALIESRFQVDFRRIAWGKLMLVLRPLSKAEAP